RVALARASATAGSGRTAPVAHRLTTANTPEPRHATMPFAVHTHQVEALAPGADTAEAVISVATRASRGSSDFPAAAGVEAAEVIVVDCSGSMAYPFAKMKEARRATAAAIQSLREGTWFAVVRANESAECVYPTGGGLVQATAQTTRDARKTLRRLWP